MTYAHIVGLLFVGFFLGVAFSWIAHRQDRRDARKWRSGLCGLPILDPWTLEKTKELPNYYTMRYSTSRDLAREVREEGHPEDMA